MKQEEIEANDERNVAIRRRAQAVAGEVLQWSVMAAAWISHRLWCSAVGDADSCGRVYRQKRAGAVPDGALSAGDVRLSK